MALVIVEVETGRFRGRGGDLVVLSELYARSGRSMTRTTVAMADHLHIALP